MAGDDDDYDDDIQLPPEPDWGYEWDPLEFEDLRASRRFAAYAKIALRAATRVHNNLRSRFDEAEALRQLAVDHPDLLEYHEDRVWKLIDWIRGGATVPKPAKLTPQQRGQRAAALARQRGTDG